ncbi:hypothetical protein [uncultured Kiloniella sp.]|uniref:hypothetical protein n=1 Tax=uncultured Kiloniella sp. TaxID=1133091 RepID=UPI0026060BF1|nr:hypothetical protein [uncultured Kiloniella sp.]
MSSQNGKNNDLENAINRLKRGLISNHDPTQAMAYKAIYESGVESIPLLLRELKLLDFEKHNSANTILAAGFLTILHDLDEKLSEQFVKKSITPKTDPVIKRSFDSILRFKRANFTKTEHRGVLILEDKTLDPRNHATGFVLKWLEIIPDEDLKGIPRIYIIPLKPQYDFSGQYLPYIGVINLVWFKYVETLKFLNPIDHFFIQKTLYHEIGHHFHKHKEGGQVPSQEEEADRYAYKKLRIARPKVSWFLRMLAKIFRTNKKHHAKQTPT